MTQGKLIRGAFFSILACFLINIAIQGYAQQNKSNSSSLPKEENFNRPQPTRPIKPEIPSVNRYQTDKVFLEYADSLYKVPTFDSIERQILKGSVKFRQAGMWMYCDSAYYFPTLNSLDAFSNVRMMQGDTLFVFADKLYYDGNTQFARLKNGPTRNRVQLINRDVSLTTDSLDYDVKRDLGWYSRWGTLADKVNTLTSLYGEYSPTTKQAEFYHDVVLVNKREGYTLYTDTLHYNTATHIARITSKTEIVSAKDTIITNNAIYDTNIGLATLLSRSTIVHRDSAGNVTTLEGDSIIYDKIKKVSQAYRFRSPYKISLPMVITDTANKMTLIGGYGRYEETTRRALATDYPLLIEYSQGDSIFLRADTIRTFIVPELVGADNPDSNIEEVAGTPVPNVNPSKGKPTTKDFHIAKAYHRARVFKKDIQGLADSIEFIEKDSMLYLFRKPIIWSGERQVTGNRIDVHFNDSTADWALLPEYGLMSEHVDEDFYNQITGKEMFATFADQTLKHLSVSGNVETIFLPEEKDSTYNRLVFAESSYLELDMKDGKMDKLKMWPEVNGSVTPLFLVKRSQQYLQKFRWWGFLRPQRRWYGDKVVWVDNLGELSKELEDYFNAPSDFGEPKTFGPNAVQPKQQKPSINPPKEESIDSVTEAELESSESQLEKESEQVQQQTEEIEESTQNAEESGYLDDIIDDGVNSDEDDSGNYLEDDEDEVDFEEDDSLPLEVTEEDE